MSVLIRKFARAWSACVDYRCPNGVSAIEAYGNRFTHIQNVGGMHLELIEFSVCVHVHSGGQPSHPHDAQMFIGLPFIITMI